jgi:hypothetical protein
MDLTLDELGSDQAFTVIRVDPIATRSQLFSVNLQRPS